MLYLIILLSLIGIALTFLKKYAREHRDDEEPEELEEIEEHHPIAHIKSVLFLEIPLEKIAMGYFILVTLIYSGIIIAGAALPELDFAVLFLSAVIILLLVYNLVMVFGIGKRFSWRVFTFLLLSCLIFTLIVYVRPEAVSESLLLSTFPYTLTIHMLGVVLGLGGALILDVMIFHFLRNFSISDREAIIMHLLSQMIVLGLIMLIVSGIVLMFTDLEGYLENSRFLMKMTAVAVVILNGIILNLYIAPKMELISLHEEDREENQTLVNVSFIVGAISGISWFAVFILAMIDILETFSYGTLLGAYLFLLAGTISASLFTKRKYELSAESEGV